MTDPRRSRQNAQLLAFPQRRPVMPPIGCFVWSGCHDRAVAAGPANARYAVLPTGLAVRLQQGGPLESVAGGLQADSGHDAGAYW
jgi:hypothetical protein